MVVASKQSGAPAPALTHARRSRWKRLGAGIAALALFAISTTGVFADHLESYQVQPGDTLYGIAREYGVPPDQLAELNGMTDPNALHVGQTLVISAPGSTANGLDDVATIPAPPPPAPPILSAPYFSQFDGGDYSQSNCGPTALSMALGALGIGAPQMRLRHWADVQMGTNDPDSGTTWESLAFAAQQYGASVGGLYGSSGYHSWSVDELEGELAQRHPVLLLVRYWDLPGHGDSSFPGDHYIVALGVDGDGNVVYNDPAYYNDDGAERAISPKQLQSAWGDTWVGMVRTAMAVYK